jgi:hypothetical protein
LIGVYVVMKKAMHITVATLALIGAGEALGQGVLLIPPTQHVPARHGFTPRSIPVHVVTGAPYSLLKTETSVKTLGDGTKITYVTTERMMRDSEGRTRDEHSMLFKGEMQLQYVSLMDPIARTDAMMDVRTKTVRVQHLTESTAADAERDAQHAEMLRKAREERAAREAKAAVNGAPPAAATVAAQPNGFEKLTPQTVAGVYAEGTRTTTVIPAGRDGNDREMKTVSEFWWSPDLQIAVGSTRDDPQQSKVTDVVTELERVEPDPALFHLPADYKVEEEPAAAGAP